MTHACRKLSLHTPATYRIQVQGHLDASWSPSLSGMAICSATTPERGAVTTLQGKLLDQAALAGVLDWLYTLGLPVISVVHVPEES